MTYLLVDKVPQWLQERQSKFDEKKIKFPCNWYGVQNFQITLLIKILIIKIQVNDLKTGLSQIGFDIDEIQRMVTGLVCLI